MPFKDKEKKKQYDKQWHLDNKEHMKQKIKKIIVVLSVSIIVKVML